MKLDKNTEIVLKNFATINTNLVIKPGKSFSTWSMGKDILATYSGETEFAETVSIYNLPEFLAVLSAFKEPELDLGIKSVVVKEDKQKVTYVYADESLLSSPSKAINMPAAEIEFDLTADNLAKIQKMSSILSVGDLAFIGDGEKLIARVYDSKNPTGNSFDIDLETETQNTFNVILRVEKLKVIPSDYKVEISSKRISKFTSSAIELSYWIAVEGTSTFN